MADKPDVGKKRDHDPSFKGPMHGRSCTDIPCCIIFVLYVIGMIVVSIIAIREGDPRRLLYPTDSDGKICGHDYGDKKFLVFFDITKCISTDIISSSLTNPSCATPQVCVKECPKKTAVGIDGDPLICTKDVKNTTGLSLQEKANLIQAGKCAPFYLESTSLFYRCVPKQFSDAITVLKDNTGQFLTNKENKNVTSEDVKKGITGLQLIMDTYNVGMRALDDIQAVWYWLIVGFVVSMVVALIYIILTRWIAAPLIWVTMIGSLVALGYGMYICFYKYKQLKDAGIDKGFEWKFTSDLEAYTQSQTTWLVLGIILVVVFIILFLLILVMRKRIQIATSLIKEASKAVCSMLSTLFFPIVPWLLQIVVFSWFIIIAVYLATNGQPVYEVVDPPPNGTKGAECELDAFYSKYGNTNASCLMVGYKSNVHLFRMQVYHLFGWLWLMNFIIALGQVILAGAFASYYFAFNKPDDIPALPLLSSTWRAIRYHLGSIAFGAAIIAVVQLIRITLEYIDRKLKEANQDNGFVKFTMKCLKCCFWCLEKCLRYLNKNAYILVSIYGRNFCASAKDAFFLLLRNALRVVAINSVTTFLFFLGKILIVGVIGIASYYFFNNIEKLFDTYTALNYAVVPMLITVIGAWVVCILFFDVYEMAIDTIFLCFLEDCERNDGSAEKPYFMSKSLRNIIGVSNKLDQTDGEENPESEEINTK